MSILSSPSEWPAEAARVQQKAAENQGNALTKVAKLSLFSLISMFVTDGSSYKPGKDVVFLLLLLKVARLKVQPQPHTQAGQAKPDAQAGVAAIEDEGSLAKGQGLDSGEEEVPLLERKRQANIKRNKQASSQLSC